MNWNTSGLRLEYARVQAQKDISVARYVDEDSKEPLPPNPAYCILVNGITRTNLTSDQLDEAVAYWCKSQAPNAGGSR